MMRIVLAAVPREYLGNKSKQKDSYKDRHVGNKNGGLIHHAFPGPFSRVFLLEGEVGCPTLAAPLFLPESPRTGLCP
jgi:hypothetical protein